MAEERDLEQACRELLSGTWITFDKLINQSENGWPDRTLMGIMGELALYEFKASRGRLRSKQRTRIKHLTARGFIARKIDNVTDFKKAIKTDFAKTIRAQEENERPFPF